MPTKILMICGDACMKCVFLKPHLKSRAEKNGISFEEKDIKEATQNEIEWATSLPVVWFDNEQKDYDEVLSIVSK